MRSVSVLACVTLTACSSSSSGSTAVLTAQSVADKLGCTGVTVSASADRAMFTSDEASCSLAGDTLTVSTFTNNTVRDSFVKIAGTAGGVRMQVADREVVYGQNATTADTAKAKLGGDIRQ